MRDYDAIMADAKDESPFSNGTACIDCKGRRVARGMCENHYRKWARRNKELVRKPMTIAEAVTDAATVPS